VILAPCTICGEEPAPRLVSAERVVALRGGGYFPMLVKLRDGTLGAVVRGGAPHVGRRGRLDFIRSTDGGRTWTAPVVAADGPWDNRNPALGQMPDESLLLAYAEARSYRADGTFDLMAGPYVTILVTARDCGKSWSARRSLKSPISNPSPFGKTNVARDGTAMLSLYEMPSKRVGLLRLRDSGKTWSDWTILPGRDETQTIEISDGHWMAFTRIGEPGLFRFLLSESHDAHGRIAADCFATASGPSTSLSSKATTSC